MKYTGIFLIILISILFISCEKDYLPYLKEFEVEEVLPTGNEDYISLNSEFIFNQDSLFTFELLLTTQALDFLDADPAAEEYVPAQLKFRGETLSPVALRYKGSIGTFAGCLEGTDIGTPSGSKRCTKLSMKIDVNYYNNENTFYDLDKLQLHSMIHDHSQMHERLAYWLFRKMGVPSPRCVHAKVVVNGVFIGLFVLVEQVNENFARFNFSDGSGNIYKEVWPVSSSGKAYTDRFYANHLKSNEENDHDGLLIKHFGEAVENADEEDLKSVVAEYMDVSTTLSYAVVDRTIRVDDGPFHWYVHNGRIYNHNYYWYEEPSEKKLYLIPYDLDNAFENIMWDYNSAIAIADEWGGKSNDCEPFAYSFSGKKQRSAACDKLTAGWVAYESEYEQIKTDFINGPLSETTLQPLLEKWELQIHDATIEAAVLHEDAISLDTWKNAMNSLRESLEYARQ